MMLTIVRKQVKLNWFERRKTKWTPARFMLLLSVLLSPLIGLLWPPLAIIMPLLGISTWISTWKDRKYGYKRNGKFDWKFAFLDIHSG